MSKAPDRGLSGVSYDDSVSSPPVPSACKTHSIASRIFKANGMRADPGLCPQGLLGQACYIGIMAHSKAFPGRAARTNQ